MPASRLKRYAQRNRYVNDSISGAYYPLNIPQKPFAKPKRCARTIVFWPHNEMLHQPGKSGDLPFIFTRPNSHPLHPVVVSRTTAGRIRIWNAPPSGEKLSQTLGLEAWENKLIQSTLIGQEISSGEEILLHLQNVCYCSQSQ